MNGFTLLIADHQWFHGLNVKKKHLLMFVSGSVNTVANCNRLFCPFGLLL